MFGERLKTHHSAMSDAKAYAMGPRPVSMYLNTPKEPYVQMDKATIYIHIPFCRKICSFCNMRRSLQKPKANYHLLVIEEIKKYSQLAHIQNLKFDAIYFGGGTPTTLEVDALEQILSALKSYMKLTDEVEITIETTVTELDDDKLAMFKRMGVNRFSVGVQTFNDQGRKVMGRIGAGMFAFERLKYIKSLGFKTISMDLIYNYPGQTREDLLDDLNKMIELDIEGFSMYSLIDMKETKIDQAGNQDQDEVFFNLIADTMGAHGYEFLELTKMVKTDAYKYVMNRHQGSDTLPLGAGAGGNVMGLMMMNPINLDEYEASITNFETKQGMLFGPQYKEVTLFKGAIQTGYLPGNTESYEDLSKYEKVVAYMLTEGYIVKENEKYRLTKKGIFWGNSISRYLYDMRKK